MGNYSWYIHKYVCTAMADRPNFIHEGNKNKNKNKNQSNQKQAKAKQTPKHRRRNPKITPFFQPIPALIFNIILRCDV